MFKRDYLIKQFEEFGKVLGSLFGLKKEGKFPEMSELISESVKKYTPTEINFVESTENQKLIEILTEEKKLSDDQLKMLADLVYEKGIYYSSINEIETKANNCFKKSLILYSFLKQHATMSYSLDMHYKMEMLQKMDL
ncbi:MAG: hypothetical protein K0R26_407 [Bacteroidota bacterium]|jgi:hypothetical protein|nr:hypothetical protein [Bacteroidota bacterium]